MRPLHVDEEKTRKARAGVLGGRQMVLTMRPGKCIKIEIKKKISSSRHKGSIERVDLARRIISLDCRIQMTERD